jgi:Leucine-rich repeat (LRR) protein
MTLIDTLDFSNNKIVEISHDFPDNFQEIILYNNKILKIHDSLYKNKKKLKYLVLHGNEIDEIFVSEETTEILDETGSSLKIDLSINNLKELKPFTFGSIKSNLWLNVSKNSLTFLPENLFDGSKIRSLNFANNLIEKLHPNVFENARLNVSKADFSYNKIELLDEKLFEKWESLKELNFGHNQIKILPEKLFDNVNDSLKTVSFADNQISKIGNHTFVNCKQLKYIDLRGNACFGTLFHDNRDQHEFCSGNCKDSCFIVSRIDSPHEGPIWLPPLPGAFRAQQVCKEGQTIVGNKCRYVRGQLT